MRYQHGGTDAQAIALGIDSRDGVFVRQRDAAPRVVALMKPVQDALMTLWDGEIDATDDDLWRKR